MRCGRRARGTAARAPGGAGCRHPAWRRSPRARRQLARCSRLERRVEERGAEGGRTTATRPPPAAAGRTGERVSALPAEPLRGLHLQGLLSVRSLERALHRSSLAHARLDRRRDGREAGGGLRRLCSAEQCSSGRTERHWQYRESACSSSSARGQGREGEQLRADGQHDGASQLSLRNARARPP